MTAPRARLVLLSGCALLPGCALVGGALDAVFGGPSEGEGEGGERDGDPLDDSMRDADGEFDPSRVLDEESNGNGDRHDDAARDPSRARREAPEDAPDTTEKVVEARNPDAPDPGTDESGFALTDFALELLAIAILAAVVTLVVRMVHRKTATLALILSVVAVLLSAWALGRAGSG